MFLGKDNAAAKKIGLPWFVVGFFVLAGINSFGVIPAIVSTAAVTAIRSPLARLLEAGPRPLVAILVSTLVTFALALASAYFLIG